MLGCKPAETPMETNYMTRFSQESPLVDTRRTPRGSISNSEIFEVSTWKGKKQSMVARSIAEAKFRALSQGICEGIWLKRLLSELRIQVNSPMEVKCDNLAAISIAKHPVHRDRTKHVEIDRHFIKENLDSGNINLSHTPSHLQVADILTKSLCGTKFEELSAKLGMINIMSAA
ncbi:Retrovirus-related Pol polyprotein from transposon RE2 [Senna tora]|uniref:Retrovirus-related Pol polyprotein from transposon RE2 n=1 Tax=Senna tora TaxID=362788 RepID=A0A834W3D2_9FABA|nr:Retrovirus-related Pol polyprotein from transposon RE2 [Senna tora]